MNKNKREFYNKNRNKMHMNYMISALRMINNTRI